MSLLFLTAMLCGINAKSFKMSMWCLLPKILYVSCSRYFVHFSCLINLVLYFVLIDWFGLIFLRSGFYSGGVFRFHIFIGKNFPHSDIPVRPTFHFSTLPNWQNLSFTECCLHTTSFSPQNRPNIWSNGNTSIFWEVANRSSPHLAFIAVHKKVPPDDWSKRSSQSNCSWLVRLGHEN